MLTQRERDQMLQLVAERLEQIEEELREISSDKSFKPGEWLGNPKHELIDEQTELEAIRSKL